MNGDRSIQLSRHRWRIGDQIGRGGFARVYEATSDGQALSVAKLIPKLPGAQRELLFSELNDVRNVLPILDDGEDDEHWILVMPRAEKSLRDEMRDRAIEEETVVEIVSDVVDALVDLDGRVVHRDIKPENILYYDNHWSLADFGIARYADATTALDTRKDYRTFEYAAPEQWLDKRATSATDVYAVGVLMYELLNRFSTLQRVY